MHGCRNATPRGALGLAAGLTAILLCQPARAEGDLEIFGGAHFFSDTNRLGRGNPPTDTTALQHTGVVGLRFGYLPIPRLAIEAEFGVIPTGTQVHTAIPVLALRAHLLVNILTGRVRPFVLLGGGGMILAPLAGTGLDRDAEGELHAGAGLKIDLGPGWGLRFDGRVVFPQATVNALTVEGEVLGSFYLRLGDLGDRKPAALPPPRTAPPPAAPVQAPVQAPVVEASRDSDGDGLPDNLDKCPNQPGPVENDGCPDVDTDGDGIVDRLDKCPNEPETKNGYQDEDGCPDEVPQAVAAFTGTIEGVNFQTAKAVLTPGAEGVLDRAAKVLLEYTSVRLEVAGHTDGAGNRQKNVDLSQRRAEAVVTYLRGKGVAAERLKAVGFGPDRPVADNKSPAGRQKNRRVEFRLLSGT